LTITGTIQDGDSKSLLREISIPSGTKTQQKENRKMKRKTIIFLATILLASLLLSACGSATESVGQETAPPAGEDPTEMVEEPEATEVAISTLRIGGVMDPGCLNTWSCGNSWWFIYPVYEGLTGVGPGCDIYPRLAKSWEVSNDGLTWTLQIQEGAKYSDGTPFTAQTFVDFIEWIQGTDFAYWNYTTWNITDINAIDETTVQFTTDVPLNQQMVLGYDFVWVFMLPPHIWGEFTETDALEFGELPTGTGPYEIVEYEQGQHIIYEANPDYYLGTPAVDRMVYQIYSNWDAVVQALLSGEIDVTFDLPLQYYDTLANQPDIVIEEQPPGLMNTLRFNMAEGGIQHPAILDLAVREAIDYAIDKQSALNIAVEGRGQLCVNQYCGPLHDKYFNSDITITPYDLVMANQILDDAGYLDTDGDGVRETSDGLALKFSLIVESGQPIDLIIADQMKASLNEIGITIETEILDTATFYDVMLGDRTSDLALNPYYVDTDPMEFDIHFSCWSAEAGISGFNKSGYCNPEVDDLIYQYATTASPEEALIPLYQLQEIIKRDRPMTVIVGPNWIEALRTDQFDFPIPGNSCDMAPGHWNWPLVLDAKPK
jgi:peptide/nickel transport system substrate-binding protein